MENDSGKNAALTRFSEAVRTWFDGEFEAPTVVQAQAWEAIARGCCTLVIAPTGSGKTLAAFLSAIDRLAVQKAQAAIDGTSWDKGVRTLYVSPLKALGADIERNLQRPLEAIMAIQSASVDAAAAPPITIGMRTGDTSPDERRRIQRNPPDILITTPESLYLMLTSQAREVLRTVQTVIVDEVHALAGNKRGSHLSLSMERLDCLLAEPAQRIGLSATVEPVGAVACFLGGPHPVDVIGGASSPAVDIQVSVPVADMTAIPSYGGASGGSRPGSAPRRAPVETAWKSDRALRAAMEQGSHSASVPDSRAGSSSIWPHIESAILDQVLAHRSTIVFVNSRGLCEKLTARLNELYTQRQGFSSPGSVAAGYWSPVGSAAESAPAAYRSDMGSSSLLAQPAADIIAKAHHGSVSKEKRRAVEAALKRGELPCVVATSSLELGIDMGDVDLVLQVAPPPSVSSGLQRIGRANHRVGAASPGVIYPRTRPEIVDAAVVSEAMAQGAIEPLRLVENPLDVLAQQTVAAVAMDEWEADAWYRLVVRSANYASLPRSAFDAVLAMLAGSMDSGDVAEFRPRILWDRSTGLLKPRPGSQRLAVTASGTIPDRGMFSVVLPEGDGSGRRRVGELDEEMVMESRVGDIIALGTSTWRIAEITGDRVIVQPAPGRSARLPFWHGEAIGRPPALGRARGLFLRALEASLDSSRGKEGEEGSSGFGRAAADRALEALDPAFRRRLDAAGLDAFAQANLASLALLQREATGALPTDRTLVVEQCQDELGDWRIILHSPFGRRIHEPWALAVSARLKQAAGIEVPVMAGDDGLVLSLPMTSESLPGASLFRFDTAELQASVQAVLDHTALFAARFRECAARALLMTPPQPGKRSPLWQQRLKGGKLLEAARREKDFPIMAEAARECLQDVFDMDGLMELMEAIDKGAVQLVEARTAVPSPLAASLIFGYVGEHLYEGDLPHAERQASLLAIDPALLGELLGNADPLGLIDPAVSEATEARLQHRVEGWQARDAEELWDILRDLGPLTASEAAERCIAGFEVSAWLGALEGERRAFPFQREGRCFWAAADDGVRLRALLGINLPPWLDSSDDGASSGKAGVLDGLAARFARTHGPFSEDALAGRFALGTALVLESLRRLEGEGRLVRGRRDGRDLWCSVAVLKMLRSRSRTRALEASRPVPPDVYMRFLLERQGVGAAGREQPLEDLAEVIALYEGVFLEASLWEAVVFPARVPGYKPQFLDELVASGDVLWIGHVSGAGSSEGMPGSKGRTGKGAAPVREVAFYPADSPMAPTPVDLAEAPWVPLQSPDLPDGSGFSPAFPADGLEGRMLQLLSDQGSLGFAGLRSALGESDSAAVAAALESLVAAGAVTSDDPSFIRSWSRFDPVAFEGAAASPAPQAPRARSRRSSSAYAQAKRHARQQAAARIQGRAALQGALAGRWTALASNQASATLQALAMVESLLDRYGVIARPIALLDGLPGGLQSIYPVLRAMEDAGDLLRGVFAAGLGPVQFATREAVEALRAMASDDGRSLLEGAAPRPEDESAAAVPDSPACGSAAATELCILAADDPANLYGAALPWPPPAPSAAIDGCPSRSSKPSRRSGALVVLAEGRPILYAAPNLKALIAFDGSEPLLGAAIGCLADYVRDQAKRDGGRALRAKFAVETFNGASILAMPVCALFEEAGFVRQPNGLRLYIDPF